MKLNDSSIYRGMKHRIGLGLCLISLCVLILPSCSAEEEPIADTTEETDRCKATIRLNVASFGQTDKVGVRSYVTGNDDENKINDIWVFQYNARTGESLKTPVYLDVFDSNDIDIELTLNEGGDKSFVCIVANTEKRDWALDGNNIIKPEFDTYDKLLQQVLPDNLSEAFLSSNLGASGGYTIPMFGVSDSIAIVSKCYVSVPLIRMFARVRVYVDSSYPHELGMKIDNITVSNIPKYCRVGTLTPKGGDDEAATYPNIEWTDFDMGDASEAIIFMPENLQGKVEGMSSKQPVADIPNNALAVNLTMSYEKDGEPRTHIYTVYPGLDMVNDFNIKRNYRYNVNIRITKLPE